MGNELNSQTVDIPTKLERQSLTPVATKTTSSDLSFGAACKEKPITKRSNTKSGGSSYRAYLWEERVCPVDASKSYYVCQGENDKRNQFTDCWDIEDPNDDLYIQMNRSLPHTICLKPRDKRNKSWITCCGTKIATKSSYSRWRLKILSNASEGGLLTSRCANIMIGIVDHQSISPDENGKGINAPFWNGNDGHFGYAIGRTKGSNNYKKKFKIGDVVTIELNRKSNGYITHNELRYYTNGIAESVTFAVDMGRDYVLAVAMCDSHCQIQISD